MNKMALDVNRSRVKVMKFHPKDARLNEARRFPDTLEDFAYLKHLQETKQ